MNWDVIITALIGVFTSGAASWITWILSRKKYNTEVDHNNIENIYIFKLFFQFVHNLFQDFSDKYFTIDFLLKK